LSRYAAKVACPVLRGERGCEAPDLPDILFFNENHIAGFIKNYKLCLL